MCRYMMCEGDCGTVQPVEELNEDNVCSTCVEKAQRMEEIDNNE
jgi:hypothetical protein